MARKKNASTVATLPQAEVETLVKPTVDEELAAAQLVVANREAKAKEQAEASVIPARDAYNLVVANARKSVEEAKTILNAALTAAGMKSGTKQGPRSEAARSAISLGAALNKLAGSPKADVVTAVFGKAGYALSWAKRAERMGITPEALCAMFVADQDATRSEWLKVSPKPKA